MRKNSVQTLRNVIPKTIEPAAAGCVETGSPKGFPETRKPQASVETRERSDR